MQASEIATIVEEATAPETSAEAQETAARLSALLRHVFLYDRGNQLRVIEESGLSMTQCKALLELGGLGEAADPRQGSGLAQTLGVSVPPVGGAAITAKGKQFVDTLLVVRQAGLESFAESLSAAQRRKLDAAIDSLMDREDIAETYEHLKGVGPA